ncbi:helix-turn-helix domain-containing protein [Cohnella sp. GCM10027633]|uniref:AraC family transcriptional regulator n=1 Tax=unclassified Cohnella TaxID=2636738 RepID=UPI003624B7BB
MFYDDFALQRELVFQAKAGSLREHELHHHDALEFHILQDNEARFQLVDRCYEGKPGDVFLFRPFEPHWNFARDPDRPIRWISILFSPSVVRAVPDGYRLLAPFYAVESVSPHIPASSPAAQAIHRLAAQALEEQRTRTIGWEAKQLALFIDILIHTLRHSVDRGPEGDGDDTGDALEQDVFRSIAYILAHFAEPIDAEELVRITGRKRTFFYKKFKAVTGLTPNVLIRRLRMQTALFLLGRTDKPVTEVAFECGYQSVSFFNKHFKSYRQLSPREYRKSTRGTE